MIAPAASYLELGIAELRARAAAARELLGPRCLVCPRRCRVDRRLDRRGLCGSGRHAVVASAGPHFGEEDCLRGRHGSGTVFFSGCSLRCVFCQNWDISWQVRGREIAPAELGRLMAELQARGCHNINWVTPEHVVPQVLEALPHAVERGLRVPVVYNTSSFDSSDCLRLLDGVVDVYMPDFKLWSAEQSRLYLRRDDYPVVAREAIAEMQRQVGDLVLDDAGLARRGLIVRHLVLPGLVEETVEILRWIASALGTGCYVNLMAQYRPAGRVGIQGPFCAIARPLYREEYERALRVAQELGLRLDARSVRERATLPRGRGAA